MVQQNSESQGLDLRKLRTQSAPEASEAPEVAVSKKLTPREIPVTVKYLDPLGHEHLETLNNRILNGDDRISVGNMHTTLTRNAPWEALPPTVREQAYMMAWLTHSLVDPPPWVLRWIQEDNDLLTALYGHAMLHEECFFRRNGDEGSGEAAKPRISLDSAVARTAAKKPVPAA